MAALAAPSIARAQAKSIKVALGWINNVEYAGVFLAQENGYFKAEGLEVTTLTGGPNAPPPPVAWIERAYNLRRHTPMPRGGHFAALEEPDLLVEDIRAFFRPLRFGAAND